MKSVYVGSLALLAAGVGAFASFGEDIESIPSGVDSRVEYRDCPKCDKRIRVDLAAGKAYVNLSRLEGAKREVYIPHIRPSIAEKPDASEEISFTVCAGDAVAFSNRVILEADCFGHNMPALIPITILG